MSKKLFGKVFIFLLVVGLLAVGDLLVTRRAWWNRLRMSREELQREHRQSEGDPRQKSERKRAHQEAMERMIEQQDQQMQELRAWLEARLPPVEAKRLGLVARVRAMLRRDRGHG